MDDASGGPARHIPSFGIGGDSLAEDWRRTTEEANREKVDMLLHGHKWHLCCAAKGEADEQAMMREVPENEL